MNIPFTSNDSDHGRSKVILFVDDEPVCDLTMSDRVSWTLKPITVDAVLLQPPMGSHKMELKTCVENGNLFIPAYNTSYLEHRVDPQLFGSIHIFGFL